MEENNIMTFEETENTMEVKDYYDDLDETSGNGNFKALALTAGVVVAGVAAVLHFTKDKREAWKEKRLEKQGFVKLKPGERIVCDEVEVDSEAVEETE